MIRTYTEEQEFERLKKDSKMVYDRISNEAHIKMIMDILLRINYLLEKNEKYIPEDEKKMYEGLELGYNLMGVCQRALELLKGDK